MEKHLNKVKNRFKVIPAVYLVLRKEGKYLFGKRRNSGYRDGWYQLPSGHLEGGESLKQAMVREAREEVNVRLTEDVLRLAFVAHRFIEEGVERIDVYFSAEVFDEREVKNNEPEKCALLRWLGLEHAEIVPQVREALQCYEKGLVYSSMGF